MEDANPTANSPTCSRCRAHLEEETHGLCPACIARGMVVADAGERDVTDLPSAAALGGKLDGIEVQELIARGGMGAVYRGRQRSLDRTVAIKLLVVPDASDPEFDERFRLEAQTLARLQHPNIVSVHDHGEIDGYFYIVMEYVDGADLAQLIRADSLTTEQSLDLALQICSALRYAHGEGIVHRDIKPANILVDGNGRASIADFGLAKILGDDGEKVLLTGGHQRLGTPFYMAPEQRAAGGVIDHRTDLFSLGVVLYEMLTGEVPGGRFAPPSRKARHPLPSRLDAPVLKALEADPERRHQSAAEFARAIEAAGGRRTSLSRLGALMVGTMSVMGAAWLLFGKPRRDGSPPPDTPGNPVSSPGKVEVIAGTGILFDDRFDNDSVVSNDHAGWTIHQVGKALAVRPASEGGVRWTTGGGGFGFAELRCNNAFVVPENGDLTVTWEISEVKSDRVGDWSYSMDMCLVPAAIDPTDTSFLPHIHNAYFPTLAVQLQIYRGYPGLAFMLRYKDGSETGLHAAQQRGEFLTETDPLTNWFDSREGRHEIWIRLSHDAIEAGWSGSSEVARVIWKETSFSPPSPRALGRALWPLFIGQNSGDDISGSHLLHRVRVEAAAP